MSDVQLRISSLAMGALLNNHTPLFPSVHSCIVLRIGGWSLKLVPHDVTLGMRNGVIMGDRFAALRKEPWLDRLGNAPRCVLA